MTTATTPPPQPLALPALSQRRELWLLFTLAGIQFTNILDFMIMMPLGPQLTHIFAISDAQFGLLVSAYTFAAGLSGLLSATYLDKFDRKKLLLCLYALFGLATLACGLAPTYELLMVARVLAGIFGGVLSALSQTIVGDAIPFERRGRAMGIVMTSFSVSTVAGVPLGLLLAAHLSWHAPFFAIAALVALLTLAAATTLPSLRAHLGRAGKSSAWENIHTVLADANHLKALLFTGLVMFAGFTVIPFITIFVQTNVGWRADEVPYIYLCGGVATIASARILGLMTDRRGKIFTFRLIASLSMLPMVLITQTQGWPAWAVLLVTTAFFTCVSGRMIPGMAITTSAANPGLRGTFMALNQAVMSAAMGAAALTGGNIIGRDANNLVTHYWLAALVSVAASLAAIALVGRIRMYTAATPPSST